MTPKAVKPESRQMVRDFLKLNSDLADALIHQDHYLTGSVLVHSHIEPVKRRMTYEDITKASAFLITPSQADRPFPDLGNPIVFIKECLSGLVDYQGPGYSKRTGLFAHESLTIASDNLFTLFSSGLASICLANGSNATFVVPLAYGPDASGCVNRTDPFLHCSQALTITFHITEGRTMYNAFLSPADCGFL